MTDTNQDQAAQPATQSARYVGTEYYNTTSDLDGGQTETAGEGVAPVTSFENLIMAANNAVTLDEIKEVLLQALEARVGTGELAHLQALLASATGFEKTVIIGAARDAKMTIRGLGLINSYDAAAQAYAGILDNDAPPEGDLPGVLFAEGSWRMFDRETGSYALFSGEDLSRDISKELKGSWVVRTERDQREIERRLLERYQSNNFFKDAVAGLPTKNCFVRYDADARMLVTEPHSRCHKARFCVDVEFSRTATAPVFVSGLQRVLPDQSKLQALQEILGCILFEVTPPQDAVRRMVILSGVAGSGKSTFIDVARLCLPPEMVTSVPLKSWNSEFSRARLAGSRLNYCTELTGNRIVETDILKQVTARETVTARHRYEQEFEFRPQAFHVFATNELPHISDNSGALDRRILILHFDQGLRPSEMDSRHLDRVREEIPGIFAWAADGAERLMARGRFELPIGHAEGMLRMKFRGDVVALFAHTQLERAPGQRISSTDLQAALREYAQTQGYDRAAVTGSGTMRRLSALMEAWYAATRSASNNAPFYTGVALKGAAPPRLTEPRLEDL